MKLVRIYCSESHIFPAISFNPGLNVILARVELPGDATKSDHNLGKTLLARLLDFMLLKEVESDFFMRKHSSRFEGFVFFLEVLLPDGLTHATIRRAAQADTKISLKKHGPLEGDAPLALSGEESWDHWSVPIGKAKEIFDGWLAFDATPGWDFRKGLSYFLRTQNDYKDIFRIEKFQRSADVHWKPYMADLLGLPGSKLIAKYEMDRLAEGATEGAKILQGSVDYDETDLDRLSAEISLAESAILKRNSELEEFAFHDIEMEISDDLVKSVEAGLQTSEQKIYYIKRDLQAGEDGLANPIEFNLKEIQAVYSECSVALPELLVKSYEDLLEFNRKLASERNKYLRQRIRSLERDLSRESEHHKKLSEQRQRFLEVYRNQESLSRFKSLQVELIRAEGDLGQLRQHLARVEEMTQLRDRAAAARRDSERIAQEIAKQIHPPSSRYKSIRERFQKIAHEFLHVPAVLFVKTNEAGNLDFHVEVKQVGGTGEFSSEADGTTFKKLLCMAFDLAVLCEYSENRFYHFVYHDGALEGEDDRKKLALLKLVGNICKEFGIQYILSAIEHELPRNEDDSVYSFSSDEVVRELHDDGDAGRLFRMRVF